MPDPKKINREKAKKELFSNSVGGFSVDKNTDKATPDKHEVKVVKSGKGMAASTKIIGADGKVTFLQYWSESQSVNAVDELLVVLGNSNTLIAKSMVPSLGFGKVKKGQEVRIRLEGLIKAQ